MNNINYNDFMNICRTCLFDCKSKSIHQDDLIIKVLNNLTGVRFETNDELPQQICLKCFDKINEIHAFASQCKQSHLSLTKCLNNYKNQQGNEHSSIEDHKIKVEHRSEEIKSVNDIVIDELIIKQEITNESIEDVIPETSEFINVDNCFQDDLSLANTSSIKVENGSIINEDGGVDNCSNNNKKWKKRKNKEFECDVCKKVFIKNTSIKRHLRTHSGEFPYQCDICKKAFNSRSTLSNHKPIHSNERPYECDICDKSFKFSYVLLRHKRIHSGERNHECNICTKTFRRFSDLTRHKRVHSGERPYKCYTCNETFAYSSQLKKHKEIHETESSCNK